MNFYNRFRNVITDAGNQVSQNNISNISNEITGTNGVYWENNKYHVTSFYPETAPNLQQAITSDPNAKRIVQRTASVLSGTPTHPIQGAASGPSANALHIVTPKTEGNKGSMLHALNTYNMHNLLFDTINQVPSGSERNFIKKIPFGSGKLDGITSIRDRLRVAPSLELTNIDKSLLYYSQFSGMFDMYADGGGFDMWYVRNGSYTDQKVRKSWKNGLTALGEMVRNNSPSHNNDINDMREHGLRVKRSADHSFERLVLNTNANTSMPSSQVNTFGFLNDRASVYVDKLAEQASLMSVLLGDSSSQSSILQTFLTEPSALLHSIANSDTDSSRTIIAPTINTITPGDYGATQPTESQNTRQNAETNARSNYRESSPIVPEPPQFDDTPQQAISPIVPSFSNERHGVYNNDIYNAVSNQTQQRPVSELFSSDILVVSPQEFFALEKQFPIGGIEHNETAGKILTTERSVEAMKTLRGILDNQHNFSDDAKFYEKIGTNGLPKTAFDIREVSQEEIARDRHLKKRLQVAGALVGVRGNKQTWLVDDVGYTNAYRAGDSTPADYNRNTFMISNTPTPEIDFNHENWELVNTNLTMEDALSNGYVIPLKDNKAIFAPSFATPDMRYGIEFETNISDRSEHILDTVHRTFGYDLNKMNFKGNFEVHAEASASGDEYVTPIMEGIRGIKATYMFAEALKMHGARDEINRGTGRNDPTGIHVNMGTVPDILREDSIKFAADYLRLVEDVYKKMTGPDARYRYKATSSSYWAYNKAVQPDQLTLENINNTTQFRQFWAQSMSAYRKAGNTGISEYEFYRQHGEFWGTPSMHPGDHDTQGKLPKYKTIAMNKLQLAGIIEARSPMFIAGGTYALQQLFVANKIGSDIYNGAKTGGSFALTDKLVPHTNGWSTRSRQQFDNVVQDTLGISSNTDKNFMWEVYQKCKNHR